MTISDRSEGLCGRCQCDAQSGGRFSWYGGQHDGAMASILTSRALARPTDHRPFNYTAQLSLPTTSQLYW